jgi:glycosyltransferase involved in cell wall biosynthesis
MKNILFVTPYFYPYISGLTVYVKTIADYLSQYHNVRVFCYKHNNNLKTHENINKIFVTRITPQIKLLKGSLNLLYPFLILKEIKQANCIFIVVPHIEAALIAFLTKLLGKRIILIHLCDLDLNKNPAYKIASFASNLSAKLAAKQAHKIISLTADYSKTSVISNYLNKTNFFIPPVKLVQPNTKFFLKLKNKYKDCVKVGFVGRLSQEKGIVNLIEAINILNKNKKGKFRVFFAGPEPSQVIGEKKFYDSLFKNNLNLNTQIFLGKLTPEELASFYKFIDVLVLPSTNKTEALGLVQLEALLHKTPLAASNLPGVRNPITISKAGLLFEPGNSIDLANKILQVVNNKEMFKPKDSFLRAISNNNTYKLLNKIL